jgi:hypothetical protein
MALTEEMSRYEATYMVEGAHAPTAKEKFRANYHKFLAMHPKLGSSTCTPKLNDNGLIGGTTCKLGSSRQNKKQR